MEKRSNKVIPTSYEQLVKEAKKIICCLRYHAFLYDSSFIDDVVSKILECEYRWKPDGGASLKNFKLKCILNLCRKRYQRFKTRIKIVENYIPKYVIDTKYNIENTIFCQEIIDYINNNFDITTQQIFHGYFINNEHSGELSNKLNLKSDKILHIIRRLKSHLMERFAHDLESK